MPYSIIYFFLIAFSLWASDPQKPQGCEIPESGPKKGVLPKGCNSKVNNEIIMFAESQIRCRIVDVKCNPTKKGEYVALAKVDRWLRGEGPQKVEFRFSKKQKKLGRGLCADLTLERENSDWILTKVENPTSSSDSLPSCP